MNIPHYMTVDPRTGTLQVHSDLYRGRYSNKEPYIFGDSVPFGPWTVETLEFRRYGRDGQGPRGLGLRASRKGAKASTGRTRVARAGAFESRTAMRVGEFALPTHCSPSPGTEVGQPHDGTGRS
ncbi:hypothetical protein ACWCQB_15685 [Streptomyces hirsutus]